MYDILLKWGLENLSKGVIKKSDKELSIMLEAIRAKNTLIIERFRYSWETCQAIISLSIKIEDELEAFVEDVKKYDWSTATGKKGIKWNLKAFHAKFARQLKKIRCNYDSTNDLLSAYSSVYARFLHFDIFEEIAKAKKFKKRSDVIRLYRGLWQFYARVMSSLVRVTSSDLRFWLTDAPYITVAFDWANKDYLNAKSWLSIPEGHGEVYFLSLETPDGLYEFWKFLDSSNANAAVT